MRSLCPALRSPPRYAPLPTLWLCPLALSSEGRGERLPPLRCGERVGRGSSPRVCYRYPSAMHRNGAPATLRSGRGQSQRREGRAFLPGDCPALRCGAAVPGPATVRRGRARECFPSQPCVAQRSPRRFAVTAASAIATHRREGLGCPSLPA
jgi:hypothetical protein